MFLTYWACSLAALGWVWFGWHLSIGGRVRAGKSRVMAKYKTSEGGVPVIKEAVEYRGSIRARALLVGVLLSVLPFVFVLIPLAWLAIPLLVVLSLALLFWWWAINPVPRRFYKEAKPEKEAEVGAAVEQEAKSATGAEGGAAGQDGSEWYRYTSPGAGTALVVILLAALAVWNVAAWRLSLVGLQGWTLYGAVNVLGIGLTLIAALIGFLAYKLQPAAQAA